MKIGFYAPCNEFNRQSGPLLGIAYIASYLREQLGVEDMFLEVDAQKVLDQKPDLIAISAFSEKYNQVIQDVAAFKSQLPQTPVILGGPHISAMPHSLHEAIDVGVIGEGEKPMRHLVSQVMAGGLDPEGLRQVKNLIFWDEHRKLERTLFEDRIKDLDALPLPDRDLMKAWWPSLNREVVFDRGVYTSRGCSFRCHFCMYSERANLIRYVSVDKVMEDILHILSHYPEQERIVFYDDLFVTKKSRLKELGDAIRSENIHQKISFGCMAKTSFFDAEYAQLLRDMNMKVISWGFESGADPVLHYLKDRHSTVRKHQDAIDLCDKYGIHSGGYFIVGSPPETESQMAQTYWFIRNNRSVMPLISVFPLIPLPGTSLWHETAQRGLIDDGFQKWDELEFLSLDQEQYLHLNEHYSVETLKTAYDHSFEPLMKWTSAVFSQVLPHEAEMQQYYQSLAPKVSLCFPPQSHLLVLNRGEREMSFALEKEHRVTELHWRALRDHDLSTYDGIVLTHTLEKFGLNSPEWQQLQASGLPIYLLVENVGHIVHLGSLLLNHYPIELEELDIYRAQYRYSLKTLLDDLSELGMQPEQVDKYPLKENTPIPKPLEMMLKTLTEHLPVHSWVGELNIYSYGLFLPAL